MTCIVGIKHEGGVVIGGDSAGTGGYSQTIRADSKVFTNGGYLMGFTSSFRMGQILRYADLPAVPTAEEQWDLDRFMATTFIDAIRERFKEDGWLTTHSGVDQGGTFLVGVRGDLYEIQSDFQIGRNFDDYAAVGCGDDLALGVLHFTAGGMYGPTERITAALEAASHHSAGVAGPFVIESQRAGLHAVDAA